VHRLAFAAVALLAVVIVASGQTKKVKQSYLWLRSGIFDI